MVKEDGVQIPRHYQPKKMKECDFQSQERTRDITLGEVIETKYHMLSLLGGIQTWKQMNFFTKQ